jgi:MIP family channel proteins
MSSLARRAVAEMLGTGFLIFFGCGSVIMTAFDGAKYGVFGVAVVHAFVLSLAITMTMGVSGGHLNPAVTIGLLTIKKISPSDAFIYVASQLVGALVGALLVRTILPANVGSVIAFGTPMLQATVTVPKGIAIEAMITFLLMSGVMGTMVATNAPKIGGFGVGLTLIPSIMVAGVLTGAAANPARAFGPAVISGNMTAQAVWWIGPILGGIIAALLWDKVLLRREIPEMTGEV